jgi:hypothetical protein
MAFIKRKCDDKEQIEANYKCMERINSGKSGIDKSGVACSTYLILEPATVDMHNYETAQQKEKVNPQVTSLKKCCLSKI